MNRIVIYEYYIEEIQSLKDSTICIFGPENNAKLCKQLCFVYSPSIKYAVNICKIFGGWKTLNWATVSECLKRAR
jgi:hypothetical protein